MTDEVARQELEKKAQRQVARVEFFTAYGERYQEYVPAMPEDSLVVQSAKDECDINKILERYQRSGAIDHFAKYGPEYGVASRLDFQEAMNLVTSANTMFQDLPSSIRERFGNDPGAFLDFVGDAENAEEMAELGLVDQAPVIPEAAVREAPEAPEAPKAPPEGGQEAPIPT